MARIYGERNWFKLLNIQKPNQVFMREVENVGFFTNEVYTRFYFYDRDSGEANMLKEECDYCIERLERQIERKGVKVVKVEDVE